MSPNISDLPREVQILIYAMGVIIAAGATLLWYFLQRYFKEKDAKEKAVDEALSAQKKEFFSKIESHESILKGITDDLKNVGIGVKDEFLDFQRSVHRELSEIRKDASGIRETLAEVRANMVSVSERLHSAKGEMDSLYDSVDAHSRQLSKGAKVMVRHDEQIKTILKTINENLVMVSQKKS